MNINFPPMDEKHIKEMVKKGYYSNATEVVRDAVRRQREQYSPPSRFEAAIKRGLEDVEAGRVVPYDKNFWKRTEKKVQKMAADKKFKFDPDVIAYDDEH